MVPSISPKSGRATLTPLKFSPTQYSQLNVLLNGLGAFELAYA